ncbi:beta-galactosidase [Methylocystis heyeri]|uniref:Beta-galactosidase n=1 Tax=Methylocystis heyeri TaxID=391905 RepID=A0A6B8K994_9HYPH|nr:beta-galactosidase [Methylocystis heyeri]QGM44409.1 beta-galactosidase [Methylocystis heyeri]
MTIKQRLGVCYYPEQWPRSFWAEDARRMREIGIAVVRIGEFAWSRLEPREGFYQFDWLAGALEILHRAGLEVVLGTPTATPPKWLVDKMPDMAPLGADGAPRKFGSRRHYCFSHEGYARECDRIVEALACAFGEHPAVVGWQTDNEYGCHDTVESYSIAARDAFRKWCRSKYETTEALNRAWGNVFWSMELGSFDEIELPNLTVTEPNPSHLLDFKRFSSDQVVAFNRRQVEIIRNHSPGRAILHNFMGAFDAFDHYAVGADLDMAAWDSYPLGFLERSRHSDEFKTRYMRLGDPDFQAFHHDLYRSCGRGRWQVMEQQPGAVNWGAWNPVPAPGAVRLWTYEAFAAGAEVVSFFRWRQAPFAQEQMHEGLLLPNSEPNEAYFVAGEIAQELNRMEARAESARAPIALAFDYESAFAWRIQPQGQDFSYFDLVSAFYRALRKLGLSIDVVPPAPEEMKGRKMILAPGLFAARPELAAAMAQSGALVLLGPRSGSKTKDFQIPLALPPGDFGSLLGVKVRRVESLRPGVALAIRDLPGAHFSGWREFIALGEEAEAALCCEDGEVALSRRDNFYYLSGNPNDELLDALLRRLLAQAGADIIDLPQDIRVRDNGPLRYVFNYGSEPADISEIAGDAVFLLGGKTLDPCGVAAFMRKDEAE